MPQAAGSTLVGGRYQLGALLGRGGMADVYDGRDTRLQRPVAVKLLRRDLAADPAIRARFEREGRAAARLSHPAVVGVYDIGEEAGVPFLVIERMPGKTLADRLASGPLDDEWLRVVVLQILSALSAAHAAGILHRDIKPGNVLLGDDRGGRAAPNVKVADFGIAAVADQQAAGPLTSTGLVMGTPAYLAPERLEGKPATVQADLYAVGVLLYEGLTGRKPFEGPTPLATALAAKSAEPVPITRLHPGADPRLVQASQRAMRPQPEERFSSAAEMASVLAGPPATVAAGPPVTVATRPMLAPPTGVPVPLPPPVPAGDPALATTTALPAAHSSRAKTVLAGCAAAGLLALVVFLWPFGGPSSVSHQQIPTTLPSTPPTTAVQAPPTTATNPVADTSTTVPHRHHHKQTGSAPPTTSNAGGD